MQGRPYPPLVTQPPARPRPGRSWTAGIQGWLHPEEGWSTLFLLLLTIFATVWAVEGARWVREMPSLEFIALVAVALGFLLAKIRLPAALLHPVAVVVGVIVVLRAVAEVGTGTDSAERLVDLAVRMYRWWEIARGGGISSDPVPFVFQVVVLDWVVAYLSAWFVFRSQHVWLGVVPSGTALLINLTYLPGRFTGHFLLYIMAAMLLASRLYMVHQQRRWHREGVQVPVIGASYLGHALVVAVLAIVLAWQVPPANAADPVAELWDRVSGPWREFEREFDRLFSSIGSGRAVPLHAFGRTLPFRGAVGFGIGPGIPGFGRGQDVVMQVKADQPSYWRGASYDTYTGQGWISSAQNTVAAPREARRPSEDTLARRQVTVTVAVQSPTDVLFSAGIPLALDIAAVAEVPPAASYTLYLLEPGRNRGLPSDLRRAAETLRDRLRGANRLFNRDELQQQLLPPDVLVDSITPRGADIEAVQVSRLAPVPSDAAMIRTQGRLSRGARYQVTSSASEAREEDLRKAGRDYPGWVLDRYLQLPRDLPERVRNLAQVWTERYDNLYDKAAAIERHLRADYPYTLDIAPPPQGADGVDHFLFTLRQGYSDYYASAMTVLLRSLGIPARIAVGYVAGDYDTDNQHFVVREAHAHAWPEVYFPGFGWIEFNPTPAWPELPRSATGSDVLEGEFDDLDAMIGDPDFEALRGAEDPSQAAGAIDWAAVLRPYLYLLAALSVLALAGRVAWLWGLAGLDVSAQTYEKLCRLSALGGIRLRPQETPREYAQRVGAAVPTVREPVLDIAQGYAWHVFSKRPVTAEETQHLDTSWRAARRDLLLKALRWRGRGRRP